MMVFTGRKHNGSLSSIRGLAKLNPAPPAGKPSISHTRCCRRLFIKSAISEAPHPEEMSASPRQCVAPNRPV